MFKKSLIALAVSGVVATTVTADITFDPDPTTLAVNASIEGTRSLTAADIAPDLSSIDSILGSEYQVSDRVEFTISGGEWTAVAPNIAVDMSQLTNTGGACDGTASPTPDNFTLGLVGGTDGDTTITYRVSELDTTVCGTTVGARFGIPAFAVTGTSVEICVVSRMWSSN